MNQGLEDEENVSVSSLKDSSEYSLRAIKGGIILILYARNGTKVKTYYIKLTTKCKDVSVINP